MESLMHYIQTKESEKTKTELRSSDAYVLALFRQMPSIVQQIIMRILFVSSPMSLNFIKEKKANNFSWFKVSFDIIDPMLHSAIMIEYNADGIKLSQWFKQSIFRIITSGVTMRYVFSKEGADVDSKLLQEKTEERINRILNYICQINEDSSISKGMKGLLEKCQYISYK